MPVDAITIDEDEWLDGLLPYVERSFEITLPGDLSQIGSAGDLLDVIVAQRQPSGEGVACGSSMAFYRLRRYFARSNPAMVITSGTPLSQVTALSPKALSKRLAQATGLAMPQIEFSPVGLFAFLATPVAALAAWYFIDARSFALVAVLGAAAVFLDRGGFSGPWQTVGSLASAIARGNVAKLAALGARDRPEDWWRRVQEMLADAADPPQGEGRPLMARRIARSTRIRLA